ncbi:MAG TPA: hypothetical protein VK828_04540 [Terriglobales bacterium]|jgi:hypothetical protein|nr:hypothetical protein [Terriglobales bacterium]
MNFIDDVEGEGVLVELKYCERCGGLWLRPQNTNGVYCAPCRACLAAMPDPGKAPVRKVRRRARVRKADGRTVRIGCLQGVAAAEVCA